MPTFCDIAGIRTLPAYRLRLKKGQLVSQKAAARQDARTSCFDGISILPTLIGKGRQRQHDHLYWEFHETDMLGLRRGNWELVVQQGRPSLYDLSTDPHEDDDLAAQYPDIVRLLIDKIYEDHTDNPLFPVTLPPKNWPPSFR